MHSLTNFKNFAKAELDLFEPLTVLLGRNGSGKTNLIEGIELFSTLAKGIPFNEITDVDSGGTFEVRGGLRSCIRFGCVDFGFRFNKASISSEKVDYSIEVGLRGKNEVQLKRESLKIGDRILFLAEQSQGDLMDVTYSNFSQGCNPKCTLSASRSILSRYEEVVRHSRSESPGLDKARGLVESTRRYLQNSYIFDPQPKAMRHYTRVDSSSQLLRTGANLSAVLHALTEREEDKNSTALQRITQIVQQIPEEPFAEIGFEVTSLGDVMAGFFPVQASGSGRRKLVDARILSDGTLRMLAIVTALETVPRGSRIVIEEFDNGLHPSRAKLLLDALTKSATQRKLNVLITTHNPAFMDALEESQLNSVMVCHGNSSEGGSKVTRLGDMDIAGTLGLHGGLGDFVTRGTLDQHLAPDFLKKRTKNNLAWLESLS